MDDEMFIYFNSGFTLWQIRYILENQGLDDYIDESPDSEMFEEDTDFDANDAEARQLILGYMDEKTRKGLKKYQTAFELWRAIRKLPYDQVSDEETEEAKCVQEKEPKQEEPICSNCRMLVEKSAECRSKNYWKKTGSRKSHKEYLVLYYEGAEIKQDQWVMGMSISGHITNDKLLFTKYKEYMKPKFIHTLHGTKMKILGEGTIRVLAYNGQQWIPINLEKVRYVPGCSFNLFSLSAVLEKGCTFTTSGQTAEVERDGKVSITGQSVQGMVIMNLKIRQQN